MDNNSGKFNYLKYYLFKYFWVLILPACFGLRILFPIKVTSKSADSLERSAPFSNSSDPTFFAHMADVHVYANTGKITNYEKGLKQIEKTKAKMLIISGDLTNNWVYDKIARYSKRNKAEHDLYYALTKNASKKISTIIDLSGNHDMWNIFSWESKNNDIRDYIYYYNTTDNVTLNEFLCSTKYIGDDAFILLNAATFPTPHAALDFYALPTTEYLDRVEKEINKDHSNASRVFVIAHFPVDFWYDLHKSSSGKSFKDIIKESNITMLLSGHLHPKVSTPIHHKGITEIIARDALQNEGVGYVTEDNGNTIYQSFHADDEIKAFIVNPPPFDQIGDKSYFNDNATNVKLLVFSNSSNEEITVNGKKMAFDHFVTNGTAVYVAQLPRYEGKYKLSFNGYFKGERICFSGRTVPPRKEALGIVNTLFVCGYIWAWIQSIILAFIFFPIDFSKYSKSIQEFEKKITMSLASSSWNSWTDYLCLLFGFIPTRISILRNQLWIRIALFVLVFFVLFLPIGISDIDGRKGIIWMYGYSASNIFIRDPSGYLFAFVYEELIVTPIMLFSSMLLTFRKVNLYILIDIIFIFAFFFFDYKLIDVFLFQSLGFYPSITSFQFVLIPIVYLFMLFLGNRYNTNELSDSLTAMIADHNTNEDQIL